MIKLKKKPTTHETLGTVIESIGVVTLKPSKYPTLESIAGSIPPLTKPMSIEEMRKIVAEDIANRYLAKRGCKPFS
jgi:hypothetical protein